MPSATATAPVKTRARKTAALNPVGLPKSADLQMENLLKESGFFFDLNEGVSLHRFDEAASLRNQARIGHVIDKKTVDRYTQLLKNGDTMPAIVAWEKSVKEPLLIVDGNHRFQAHKNAGLNEIDVYIIRGANHRAITFLTYTVNTRHGLATDEPTRVHQGLYMIDNGISAKDAARMLGISVHKLNHAQKLAEAGRRAEEVGLTLVTWDKLSGALRVRLNQLRTDEVFKAMAQLTIDAGLNVDDLNDALGTLTQIRNYQAQMDYITELRKTYSAQIVSGGPLDTAGTGRQRISPHTGFRMVLGRINQLSPPPSIVERLNEHDRAELATLTRDAMAKLQAVLDELKQ